MDGGAGHRQRMRPPLIPAQHRREDGRSQGQQNGQHR